MTHTDYQSVFRKEIAYRDISVSCNVAVRAALRNFLIVTLSSSFDQNDTFLLTRAALLLRAVVYCKLPSPEILDSLTSSLSRREETLEHQQSTTHLAARLVAKPSKYLVQKILVDSAAALGSHELDKAFVQNQYLDREAEGAYWKEQDRIFALSWQDFSSAAQDVFQTPLWLDSPEPESKVRDELLFARYLSSAEYSFWREWYQGFLDGKPLDWELQRRVALIDDDIWKSGPEAVAAEIERIRAEFNAPPSDKERFPKHEPKSVRHLFENRVIAYASLQGLAAQVTHSIERFHAETGANALPEALEPLAALPALLLAVNSTIQDAPTDGVIASETEDQLRAEIGRLNAKVADLESKISGLEAVIAGLPTTERKGILHLLAQTALWGSLAGGLWMLSGEDADLRDRYENLIERKEQIRILLMQEGLPQTQVEKSLRPAARPGRA